MLLLDYGADMNIPGLRNATPLIIAAQNGHTEVVHHLLGKGVNVNAQTDDGFTALDFAHKHGHSNICKLLASAMQAQEPIKYSENVHHDNITQCPP
ncbi:ankyrin [Gymnopus androsaceus JB14]|uniref:Ankyrin n=1 Tax=Gymnopus androsaceus JB14 TaxID=1447944 RepID=A0A6A4GSF6_9AGAR|nr:ankyrin [Gymnopus androsaceus JB14]